MFINLSDTDIPTTVSNLLQLGGNFCLPLGINKKNTVHEYIKDIETFNQHTIILGKIESNFKPKPMDFQKFTH